MHYLNNYNQISNNIMNILGNKNSIIENPIDLKNIIEINIDYTTFIQTEYTGRVKFKKNNTMLIQNFKGNNISDVYLQIFNFCNSL